jgi:hypothetical protein
LALCAFAFDKQLNKVDFPTFGNPTIPAFIEINFSGCKYKSLFLFNDQYSIKL